MLFHKRLCKKMCSNQLLYTASYDHTQILKHIIHSHLPHPAPFAAGK